MSISARFVRGVETFQIGGSSGLSVMSDWIPPAVNEVSYTASGTSLNRSGGGRAMSARLLNRVLTIPLRVLASTPKQAEEIVRRLDDFLTYRSPYPLYFEIKANDLPTPSWGQFGAYQRYRVEKAYTQINNNYESMAYTTVGFTVDVVTEIRPLAEGTKRRHAQAYGGIFEDVYGSSTRTSKGLRILAATTNKMTEPTFGGKGADWTAGSALRTAMNVAAFSGMHQSWVLPGLDFSFTLTSASSSNNTFTQSINAGNTNKHSFSAYIMLPDGGTPTSDDCQIYYQSARSTSFEQLGDNGLWVAYSDNVDGINSAQATGLVVKSGRTVILLAYQMEEKAYHTFLCHGDMLGCAWSGTPGNSTSTRTAGYVRLDLYNSGGLRDTFSLGQGGISFAWKTDVANTAAGDRYFFSAGASSLSAYFKASDDKIYFTDGTNTISSAAQTFSAGDVLHLDFTWGPSGLNIYKAGANIATGAYTPPAVTQYLYIGTDTSAANPCQGMFILGPDIYTTDISANVATRYAAAYQPVASGKRPSSCPWIWAYGGPVVIENCTDSTYHNYWAVGGVDGTDEAITEMGGTLSATSDLNAVLISQFCYPVFVNPTGRLFWDESGTVVATSCGGQRKVTTLNTSPTALTDTHTLDLLTCELLRGREAQIFLRMNDAGSNLVILATTALGSTEYMYAYWAGTRTVSSLIYGPVVRTIAPSLSIDINMLNMTDSFVVTGKRTASGSADVQVDWSAILPRPIMVIGSKNTMGFSYHSEDNKAIAYNDSTFGAIGYRTLSGDIIRFVPGKVNNFITFIANKGAAIGIAETWTIDVYSTPRWSLL